MPTTTDESAAPVAVELLTRAEADTLSAARDVLDAISKRAAYTSLPPTDAHVAMNRGRLAEAASVAEDALFNVLSTASSYGDDPEAARAIARAIARRGGPHAG